jgi:hypothetical protein
VTQEDLPWEIRERNGHAGPTQLLLRSKTADEYPGVNLDSDEV